MIVNRSDGHPRVQVLHSHENVTIHLTNSVITLMKHYTYVYHDMQIPIYVGKGKERRAFCHLKKSHNPHLRNKLAKMKREGREPHIQIIDAPNEMAAFEMEQLLIAMIGRHDLGTGPLLNLTDGGEGSSNPSEQTRKKRGASISKAKIGKLRDEATKQTISNTKKINGPSAAWIKCFRKPCTVDGVTIYPSKNALITALGNGKSGRRHPDFRFVGTE